MKLKNMLLVLGAVLILAGVIIEPRQERKDLWEKIPDEEIHTYIEEAEQKEDMAVDGPVQEVEYGEVRQPSEEFPPATGEVVSFTYDEAQLLMRMAQAEAGNQGIDGMWLVMSVAVNRVRSEHFPDNITDVIYQTAKTKKGTVIHQFSSVADGRIDEQTVLSYEVHEALAMVECGEIAKEIIAFEVKDSTALDKYFDYAFTFRDHRFYTERKKE